MDNDNVFRLIMVLGFAVVFPVGAYHRVKSQASGEKLNRREEGLFILATLRPFALIRIAGVFAFMINPTWMTWSAVPLPLWLRWVGVPLGVSAAALLITVFRTLGTNITDTVVTRKEHTLIKHGPYRYVRHPFYVAMAMALTADSLVTTNWFLALTGALLVTLIRIRTKTEEEKLIERFGDDYRTYMQQTGRFVPHLKR